MDGLAELIAARLATAKEPLVVGIAGSQGSGKSTLAGTLATRFGLAGVTTATLSIDDLYLTRAERHRLARDVHPLLATRGVPGTHDVALGLDVIAAIHAGQPVALPRFDKAADDRADAADWQIAPAGIRLLILEGWCVGARPQEEAALAVPVNALEAEEDAEGRWRRYANTALAGIYQALFARIDLLAFVAAPSFETVFRWREQQEQALRARTGKGMSETGVIRFIRHYERITRFMLEELPGRADVTLQLDEARRVEAMQVRR